MKQSRKKTSWKPFLKKNWFNISVLTGVVLLSAAFGGRSVLAEDVLRPTMAEQRATDLMIAAMANTHREFGSLPASGHREGAPRLFTVVSTAYSSEAAQTDATPFITASGTTVRRGVVAANFLPIGTKVKIPSLYGDEVFTVEDRMNARYSNRLDIWMETREQAKQFGVRRLAIEVYE